MNKLEAKLLNFREQKTSTGTMKHLIFLVVGTKKTFRKTIFMNNLSSARRDIRIWATNLARQAKLPYDADAPDADYLIEVEGLDETKVYEDQQKQHEETITSLINQTFDIWTSPWAVGTKSGTNYQPYEPTVDATDDETTGFEDLTNETKKVK